MVRLQAAQMFAQDASPVQVAYRLRVRPSAVEARYWTWQNVRTYPWLSIHNFRSAGEHPEDL
jgi:hypothetical protein